MCYGTCPYQQSFSGECNNPTKNSYASNAHCYTGFTCKHCGEEYTEDENSDTEQVCEYCEGEYLMENCDSDIEYAKLLNKYKPLKISVDSNK